ncbi:hypothetical protein D8B24_11320 [Verminephrobacter aporrectodeae subsp. tuberculatae]|nr:hypothetical protein [Verminephrobacter aporrectodeae subsp. tuberculatae]
MPGRLEPATAAARPVHGGPVNTAQPPRQRGLIHDALIAIACVALVLVIVGLLAYQLGRSRGLREAAAAAQARENTVAQAHQRALDAANERERSSEDSARRQVASVENKLVKERDHAKSNQSRFAAAVRTGDVRLSVPTLRDGAHCGADASPNTAPAAGDRAQARARLAPQAGLDLVAIADDGDDAIGQLNACIGAYEAVRDRFNLLPQEAPQGR